MTSGVLDLLDGSSFLLFGMALVALPVGIVAMFRHQLRFARKRVTGERITGLAALTKDPFLGISMGCFLVPIFLTLFAVAVVQHGARREVWAYFEGLESAQVTVDGAAVSDAAPIVAALRQMRWMQPHHSHPLPRRRIVVRSDRGVLSLELGQDSQNPWEYWVFYPRYRVTRLNEIGRVETSLFERY